MDKLEKWLNKYYSNICLQTGIWGGLFIAFTTNNTGNASFITVAFLAMAYLHDRNQINKLAVLKK